MYAQEIYDVIQSVPFNLHLEYLKKHTSSFKALAGTMMQLIPPSNVPLVFDKFYIIHFCHRMHIFLQISRSLC